MTLKQKDLGTLGTAPLLWSGIAGTSSLILGIQMNSQGHFLQLNKNVDFTVRSERDSPRLSKLAEAI